MKQREILTFLTKKGESWFKAIKRFASYATCKIIGITISIICIALMSIIIYDCKERVKKEKQIRKKLGVFVDIILDILDWYQLVIVIIVGLIIGVILIIYS